LYSIIIAIITVIIFIIIVKNLNYYPRYLSHPVEVLVYFLSSFSNIYLIIAPVSWITLNLILYILGHSEAHFYLIMNIRYFF